MDNNFSSNCYEVRYKSDELIDTKISSIVGAKWDKYKKIWKLPLTIMSKDAMFKLFGEQAFFVNVFVTNNLEITNMVAKQIKLKGYSEKTITNYMNSIKRYTSTAPNQRLDVIDICMFNWCGVPIVGSIIC